MTASPARRTRRLSTSNLGAGVWGRPAAARSCPFVRAAPLGPMIQITSSASMGARVASLDERRGSRAGRARSSRAVAWNRLLSSVVAPISCLLRQAELSHEVLAVPEQPFMIHCPILPVTNRGHGDGEALACRRDGCAVSERHRLAESARHDSGRSCPGSGPEPYRMNFDGDVGRVNKQGFEIFDVFLNALGLMAVWPGYDDVFGMALAQSFPLLVGEDVKVQRVEYLQVLFHRGRLLLMSRRRIHWIFDRGLVRSPCCKGCDDEGRQADPSECGVLHVI